MTLDEIKEIISLVAQADLNEIKIEQRDFKLKVIKSYQKDSQDYFQPVSLDAKVLPAAVPDIPLVLKADNQQVEKQKSEPVAASDLQAIKSPMTGTYYSSSSPGNPPFVKEGKEIAKGDTVCVIEAMKLFNEIESEIAGIVDKILVKDKQAVELDQPLFLVKENHV